MKFFFLVVNCFILTQPGKCGGWIRLSVCSHLPFFPWLRSYWASLWAVEHIMDLRGALSCQLSLVPCVGTEFQAHQTSLICKESSVLTYLIHNCSSAIDFILCFTSNKLLNCASYYFPFYFHTVKAMSRLLSGSSDLFLAYFSFLLPYYQAVYSQGFVSKGLFTELA